MHKPRKGGIKGDLYDDKEENWKSRIKPDADSVALYHVVYAQENFEESVQRAQRLHPGNKRKLYLDIEGHRNSEGGFDTDMLELQKDFLLGFLSPYLSEIHCPLVSVTNSEPQENDIPPAMIIRDERDQESRGIG